MSIGGHVFFAQFLIQPHGPGYPQLCGPVKFDSQGLRRVKKGENCPVFRKVLGKTAAEFFGVKSFGQIGIRTRWEDSAAFGCDGDDLPL